MANARSLGWKSGTEYTDPAGPIVSLKKHGDARRDHRKGLNENNPSQPVKR